ncbi:MAG: (Fe-S)-binding protein [Deltaproteobacteria bacterium]|nr:(Fe-S)-binding protein [Deltaproteobacteria bacterium]
MNEQIKEKCIECSLCQKECRFLQKHGNPKAIADGVHSADGKGLDIAFECSLCGLCGAVCPVGLEPSRLFQEMRREAVHPGRGEFPEHKALLQYEKRGTSKRYTWYGLPLGCDTVLFPGCNLPGTRPETVINLFEHLRQSNPSLGVVLDCCAKPSLDLGRQDYFQTIFGEMAAYLLDLGIRNIWVACPNCYKVFREYGGELKVKTVYEVLAENGLPKTGNVSGNVTIHDPCVVRYEAPIHDDVRSLVGRKGLTIEEMAHTRQTTLCCGEGGAVGFLSPALAKSWSALRKEEARGRRMITYCAGCVNHLNPISPTSHILDLLFQPEVTLAGKIKSSRPPMTYWNRIRLKRWFKKNVNAAVTRERVFQKE